jgi:Flp pilus assembly protein TadG
MTYFSFSHSVKPSNRRGVILIQSAILLVPLLGLIAFAVDYGYLLKVRTDLQRTADMAALAAVRDLVPDSSGHQDLVRVRATAKHYATLNTPEYSGLQLRNEDIECGRYDTDQVYSSIMLWNDGVFDTARVTVRRDNLANSSVSLFFAAVLGINDADVNATSTAILRRASTIRAGGQVLPMTVPQHVWDAYDTGDKLKIFSNGKIKDAMDNPIQGNWGTVDLGSTNNSTADISAQIENGLRQGDLDALAADGRIASSEYIRTSEPMQVQGDTGMSAGIRSAVQAIEGQIRYIPIFDVVHGGGNTAEFNVVGWGAVKVLSSNWQGNQNTWIRVEKTTTYDLDLDPHTDLGDTSGAIEGVFTAAVLAE